MTPASRTFFVARVEDEIAVALVEPTRANAFSPRSSPGDLLIALIDEAEKLLIFVRAQSDARLLGLRLGWSE